MTIIFEPDPPFIRCRCVENKSLLQDKLIFCAASLDKIGEKILKINEDKNTVLGYLLPNGGEEIDKPVSLLTGKSLVKMERCVKLLPEHNDIIYKTANYLSAKFPDSRHVLFCDSAFFISLPKKAGTYAIPYRLRKKGIRRYGGYGLCHQWAWEETKRTFGKDIKKVISVYLDNPPNISAISDGVPVETTIGFTSVEGIPSLNACGDIDPTIIFQLHAEGMSFERINDLLSTGSGLSCLFDDAPGILQYHIIRYIGAFVSILGGIDAVVFIAENAGDAKGPALRICHLLDFLGFKSKIRAERRADRIILSGDNSKIKCLCLQYDKWNVLKRRTISLAGEEG